MDQIVLFAWKIMILSKPEFFISIQFCCFLSSLYVILLNSFGMSSQIFIW